MTGEAALRTLPVLAFWSPFGPGATVMNNSARKTRSLIAGNELLMLVVAVTCVLMPACSRPNTTAPVVSAVPVLAATVEQKNVPVEIQAIGTVEAFSMVSVKTQITGELTNVFFKEGQDVHQGDLIFKLDERTYAAELKKQQANLARDTAQARLAQLDAERFAGLFKEGVISHQQYDQAQASAQALDAVVQADVAAVENARVQLTYCSIYSPINGRTGPLMIQRGNMSKANDTPYLVNISQVEPIFVSFAVPEQYLADIKVNASKRDLVVRAAIPGNDAPAVGRLSFIDNAVDPVTGTIRLKGQFANADRRLWPGQFVNATLTLSEQVGAVVVPSQAIQSGQQGQYVFVINPDLTVAARPVEVNRSSHGQAVVNQGLSSGERVVTDGQLRLVPGSRFEIKPALAVSFTERGAPEKPAVAAKDARS